MNTGRIILAWLAWLTAGAIALGGGLTLRPAAAAEDGLNACGCRQSSSGACYCEKKSHCGCPGECEPKGCEEKRAKQMEKEVQEETRKAEQAERRQSARQKDQQGHDEGQDEGRGERESEHERQPRNRVTEEHVPERAPPPAPKVRIVRMTPAQKRDLGRLIKLYLAEHPDQGGKAIGQVENEVSGR